MLRLDEFWEVINEMVGNVFGFVVLCFGGYGVRWA
jgi:hypothetical protein